MKLHLLRKISATLAALRQAQVESPQEKLMRAFFGITLFLIGLAAALPLGLPKVLAFDELHQAIKLEAGVAMFLIFGGEVTALSGSLLIKSGSPDRYNSGQWLFAACFVASALLMVVGLANVFAAERVGVSIYLLSIGFAAAFFSAYQALN